MAVVTAGDEAVGGVTAEVEGGEGHTSSKAIYGSGLQLQTFKGLTRHRVCQTPF